VVPKGFFPQAGQRSDDGAIQASQGTSFQAMQQILARTTVARRDPRD
jgi:hypothetical protein